MSLRPSSPVLASSNRPEPLTAEQVAEFIASLEHCTRFSVPVRKLLARRAEENLLLAVDTLAGMVLGERVQRCLGQFAKRLQNAGHGSVGLHPSHERVTTPDGAREGAAWSLELREDGREPLRVAARLLTQLDAERRVRLSVDLSVKTDAVFDGESTPPLLTAVVSMPLSTSARDARDVLAACAIIEQDLDAFSTRFVALELELDAVLAH